VIATLAAVRCQKSGLTLPVKTSLNSQRWKGWSGYFPKDRRLPGATMAIRPLNRLPAAATLGSKPPNLLGSPLAAGPTGPFPPAPLRRVLGGQPPSIADFADPRTTRRHDCTAGSSAPLSSQIIHDNERAYAVFARLLRQLTRVGSWSTLSGEPISVRLHAVTDLRGRFPDLSLDPAKRKVTPGSVEEAAVGMFAERHRIMVAPISREPTGAAEFISGNGAVWDVKSPLSPRPGQGWQFDAQHQVEKILHELSQDHSVLLNLSRTAPTDSEAVIAALHSALTAEQQARVVVLRTQEVVSLE
jgi:hypothetical protein